MLLLNELLSGYESSLDCGSVVASRVFLSRAPVSRLGVEGPKAPECATVTSQHRLSISISVHDGIVR